MFTIYWCRAHDKLVTQQKGLNKTCSWWNGKCWGRKLGFHHIHENNTESARLELNLPTKWGESLNGHSRTQESVQRESQKNCATCCVSVMEQKFPCACLSKKFFGKQNQILLWTFVVCKSGKKSCWFPKCEGNACELHWHVIPSCVQPICQCVRVQTRAESGWFLDGLPSFRLFLNN